MSPAGKVVAITGGARGIGRATAEALLREGAKVAIGDLDADLAEQAAAELGDGARGFFVDVVDKESFAEFIEAVERDLGPLDVLINNAGIMLVGWPFADEDDATTRKMVDVNLHGVLNGTKLALERMRPRRSGHIVNISSQAGNGGFPGGATYCATKFAVRGFSEAVRNELVLEELPVEVSCVMPTVVNTDLGSGLPQTRGVKMLQPEDVAAEIVAALREPRFEVHVPRSTGVINKFASLLPRRGREALGRFLKADQVLWDADHSSRASYEARAQASDPRATAPSLPSSALYTIATGRRGLAAIQRAVAYALAEKRGELLLEDGPLRATLTLEPFAIRIRRGERRLIRGLRLWAADGTARDQFVQMTEGVLAHEEIDRVSHLGRAELLREVPRGIELGGSLGGERTVFVAVTLEEGKVLIRAGAHPEPLRLGVEWEARPEERFTGLGARHGEQLDQTGRRVRLGADRRYTGPDCPPDMLEVGGIPQGDCAPAPWLLASRGYALWLETGGDAAEFDLGHRVAVSSRAASGQLRLHVICDPTPAARLRRYLRLTGLPALLPEWGYGHWKSRDVYEHQDDVLDDFEGYERNSLPLDAVVIDSPWETQYNTWRFNPHQFPDAQGMIDSMRSAGVRTVVWVTPWVNLDSRDGQRPPGPESERMHREPAPNYGEGAREGHFVRDREGEPFVARWWMGTGSPVDFTSPAADAWWRELARPVLEMGVEGIKADDGEGYYFPPEVQFADGRTGAEAAWAYGALYRRSMQRALDDAHPGRGVLFGRCGWTGQQAVGFTWGGDQASDFWSLQALVAASLTAAASGFSNWSHDVGGYLGERLTDRCPKELLLRWVQFGCFTPLMQAHGRFQQEAWTYDRETLEVYRRYVVLHERLVPYVRAAAATAARCGLPIIRPLVLGDPADERGWAIADAYGYGPALWVAPVLEDGARERELPLPRGDWVDFWSGERVRGGGEVVADTPLDRIPVYVRSGSVIVTYPEEHVAAGLGDVPEHERPLEATLWGEPPCGRTGVRLADGTRIRWAHGEWSVTPEREISFGRAGPR